MKLFVHFKVVDLVKEEVKEVRRQQRDFQKAKKRTAPPNMQGKKKQPPAGKPLAGTGKPPMK